MEMQIPFRPQIDPHAAAVVVLQRLMAGTGARLVIEGGHALVQLQAMRGPACPRDAQILPTDLSDLAHALQLALRDAAHPELRAGMPADMLATLDEANALIELRFSPLLAPTDSILNHNPTDIPQ